ncbi:MAG: hypothetical protein AAF289_16315, partial [Cyanobacteria bacterium P01_A01_bin.135]
PPHITMVETYQPILTKEDVRTRSLLRRRLVPEGSEVIVLYRDGQAPLVIKPADKIPPRADLLFGNYRWLYKVNVGHHIWRFSLQLRSRTAAFKFQAEVTLSCCVDDPVTVIERFSGQTDVCQLLQSRVFELMEAVSSAYDIHDDSSAAAALRDRFEHPIGETGFVLELVSLQLTSEDPITELLRERTLIQLTSRKQVTLMGETANLERTSLEQSIEMEQVRGRLDEVRQQRLERKVQLYAKLLETDSLGLLALQLAQNPDDITAVSHLLAQQPHTELQQKLNLLKAVTEENGADGKPLDDAEKQVIQRLVGLAEAARPALRGVEGQMHTVSIDGHRFDPLGRYGI